MFKSVKFKKLITSLSVPLLGAIIIGLIINSDDTYESIVKPPLAPPAIVFPIVWTLLYIMMGLALWRVRISEGVRTEKNEGIRMFSAQLILNFLWPIIFFKFETYMAALICLIFLFTLLIRTCIYFGRIDKISRTLLIPYVIWAAFAMYLNIGICILN